MDVKCPGMSLLSAVTFTALALTILTDLFPTIPGCLKITTVFSHAQTVIPCKGCSTILCTPTGGKARLRDGCSFRKKQH